MENKNDEYYKEIGEVSYLLIKEDFISFKSYSKKRSRKIGKLNSIFILLFSLIKIIISELPSILRYVYFIGSLLRFPLLIPYPPKKKIK